jgi:hypothetical protein
VFYSIDLAESMSALTGHPSLTTIELGDFTINDEICRALGRLFSAPNCKIERLGIVEIKWETNGEHFFRGLKQCKSLEAIKLTCFKHRASQEVQFEDAVMINLMNAVLPNCLRLESINLGWNNISSLAKLNTLSPMGQPTKIREFFIDLGNPVWENAKDDDRDAILQFVRSNPELGHLGEHFDFAKSDLYTPLTEHYLDMNRSGRILLSANVSRPGIPLSVWPTVLERANQLFQENGQRQANVFYHLLQGPAFRERDYFQSLEKRQRRDA